MSDFSTPYHLHRSLVTRLLRTLPKQLTTVTRSPANSSGKTHRVKDGSTAKKSTDNKGQPVVPSIEITHDTSSDEEEVEERGPRKNLQSHIRRANSAGRNSRPPAVNQEEFTGKRSKSASNIRHHQRSPSPFHTDEESEASVSSGGHASTSTSESSRRFKSGSRGHKWVNGDVRGRKQEPGRHGRSNRDVRSNSPHSLHSDDHPGTGKSIWGSAVSLSCMVVIWITAIDGSPCILDLPLGLNDQRPFG